MNIKIRLQLSTLMFLQYFVWGAWYVTISTYLTATLHFKPVEVGLVFGTFSIAAMISPFFIGLVADKFFATEKTLAVLHLLGAVIFYLLSFVKSFGLFYTGLLVYALCYTPTMALSNSLSFHQMKDPGKTFPGIRVLGTIGWIAAGMTIGFMKVESSVVQLYIAAIVSAILGLYCFTLPHVPPKKDTKATLREIIGLDALQLFKERAFAIIIIASVLTCIPLSFYYTWTNPFLNEIGMNNAAGKMTMGQMSEIFFMLVMPFFFIRLGVKKMIMIGMVAWVLRYLLFAFGNNENLVWMLYTGIILHGVCYDFFFVTGQIFVDKQAPGHLKASAQGMITFATYGLGMFIGTWFSGLMVGLFTSSESAMITHVWTRIWLIPMVIAIVVLILFAILFRNTKKETAQGIKI
jgi:nucleoside transporter